MISRIAPTQDELILKEIADCPVPDPEKVGFAETPDRVKIRYARWKPQGVSSKGTILFLGGRTEFIEKGYETIKNFLDHKFEVLSFDWRGQGGSDRLLEDRQKGYVDEFEEYVIDLETIIQDVALPDCKAPLYLVAHSAGALVALLAAPKIPNKIRRMVLCSPFLGIGGQRYPDSAIKFVAGALSAVGLGDMYLSGGKKSAEVRSFEKNVVTSDEARFNLTRQYTEKFPELAISGATANWVFAACKAIDTVKDPDFYSDITIPTLFILAGNDQVVNNHESEQLARCLRSGSTLCVDGAMHELLQEKDFFREQCLAALFSFIPGSNRN